MKKENSGAPKDYMKKHKTETDREKRTVGKEVLAYP